MVVVVFIFDREDRFENESSRVNNRFNELLSKKESRRGKKCGEREKTETLSCNEIQK